MKINLLAWFYFSLIFFHKTAWNSTPHKSSCLTPYFQSAVRGRSTAGEVYLGTPEIGGISVVLIYITLLFLLGNAAYNIIWQMNSQKRSSQHHIGGTSELFFPSSICNICLMLLRSYCICTALKSCWGSLLIWEFVQGSCMTKLWVLPFFDSWNSPKYRGLWLFSWKTKASLVSYMQCCSYCIINAQFPAHSRVPLWASPGFIQPLVVQKAVLQIFLIIQLMVSAQIQFQFPRVLLLCRICACLRGCWYIDSASALL